MTFKIRNNTTHGLPIRSVIGQGFICQHEPALLKLGIEGRFALTDTPFS